MSKVMRGTFGFSLLALTLGLGLGCTEKGRSLVLVEVSKKDATPVDHLTLVVARGGAHLEQVGAEWPAGTATLKLGVYLPKDVSGEVDVVACGLAGGVLVSAAGPQSVTVKPGETTPIDMPTSLVLAGGASVALCGNLGSDGGAGSDGAAGVAGTAGVTGTAGGGGTSGGAGTMGAAGTVGGGGMGGGGAGGTTGAAGAGGTGGTSHVVAWSDPQMAAANAAIEEQWPAVAVDAKGNAVVAFQHGSELWASAYTASTNTWGAAGVIDGRATTSYRPRIAVDKNGTYLVVWQQDPNAANKGVWWSASTDGKTWSAPAAIVKSVSGGPELSMNADGAAVVAWTEQDPTMNYNYQVLVSARPTTAAPWSMPKVLRPAVDGGGDNVAVGMTGKGEGFVTWVQRDGTAADKYSVWFSQYKQGAFSAAALFESYDTQNAFAPSIAVNAAGAAIVIYGLVDGSGATESLWARRYNQATGFGLPGMIAQGTTIDDYLAAAVVLDESGTATAAWAFKIQGKYQVYAGRGDATSAFSPATAMETDNAAADDGTDPFDHSPKATMPMLAVDPAGNVTLLWRKRVGTRFDLWARSFPKGGTWGAPKALETSNAHGVEWLSVGAGGDGTVIATWDYETEYDILAAVLR